MEKPCGLSQNQTRRLTFTNKKILKGVGPIFYQSKQGLQYDIYGAMPWRWKCTTRRMMFAVMVK
uniref:Uncharacterized protein n=1 Tax=Physcomitrium patens TaxID=3218 RepID=A0A2K1K7K1_PHYPA|nr:hypothetical protein PHYPA_011657 [Physcomitrium patens]